MTLAAACLALLEMGYPTCHLHHDHLCKYEASHRYSQCPGAPYFAFSAVELAPLGCAYDLNALLGRKRMAYQAACRDEEPEAAPETVEALERGA
jgi:hypothetical protein